MCIFEMRGLTSPNLVYVTSRYWVQRDEDVRSKRDERATTTRATRVKHRRSRREEEHAYIYILFFFMAIAVLLSVIVV